MSRGRSRTRRARRDACPLPARDGLHPIQVCLPRDVPTGLTIRDYLLQRFPPLASPGVTDLDQRMRHGEVLRWDGVPVMPTDHCVPGLMLAFYRELAPEEVPDQPLPVLYEDDHLLVIDKPHGMATMPRGRHVLSSVLVRLRRAHQNMDLVPLHRLDLGTAGVLVFGKRPEDRGIYQTLFARGEVTKTYRAVVALPDDEAGCEGLRLRGVADIQGAPDTCGAVGAGGVLGTRGVIANRLVKPRGDLRTSIVPGEVNARTDYTLLDMTRSSSPDGSDPVLGLVELFPHTGKTHQLRVHLASIGWPILADPLYGEASPALDHRRVDGPVETPDADRSADALGAGGARADDGDARAGDGCATLDKEVSISVDHSYPLQLLARALAFTDPITGIDHHFTSRRRLAAWPEDDQ